MPAHGIDGALDCPLKRVAIVPGCLVGGKEAFDGLIVALCCHHCDLPMRRVSNALDELLAFLGEGVADVTIGKGMRVEE